MMDPKIIDKVLSKTASPDEARQVEYKREQKLMDELSQRLPRKEPYEC